MTLLLGLALAADLPAPAPCPTHYGVPGHHRWVRVSPPRAGDGLRREEHERLLSWDPATGEHVLRTRLDVRDGPYRYRGTRTNWRRCTAAGVIEERITIRYRAGTLGRRQRGVQLSDYTPGALLLPATLQEGTTWETRWVGTTRQLDRAALGVDLGNRWQVGGVQTVTTPAGTFTARVVFDPDEPARVRHLVEGVGLVADPSVWLVSVR